MLKSVFHGLWILAVCCALSPAALAQSVGVTVLQPMAPFQLDTDPTAQQSITIHTTYTGVLYDHLYVCVAMPADMRGTGANSDTISRNSVQVTGGQVASWASIVGSGTNCGVPTAQLVWDGNVIAWFWQGTQDSTLTFRIAGYSPSLQADTYTGTITVYAGFY